MIGQHRPVTSSGTALSDLTHAIDVEALRVDESASRVSGTVTWQVNHRSADTVSIVADAPLHLRDRDEWEIEAVRAERSAYEASTRSTLIDSRSG